MSNKFLHQCSLYNWYQDKNVHTKLLGRTQAGRLKSHVIEEPNQRNARTHATMSFPKHQQLFVAPSNVININVAILRVTSVLVELEAHALGVLVGICVGLVDTSVFGEFAIGFQGTGFVG